MAYSAQRQEATPGKGYRTSFEISTMNDQFQFSYKCHACGVDRTVKVPWRKPAENIIQYLETIIYPAVARDHREARPICASRHVDLKLPIENETEAIGMKVKPKH